MKLFAALLLFPCLLLADNSVTIKDESGLGCSNCTFKISRYFAKGELANYPQPRVGGSPPTYWQADVRIRWNDNSVRFAVMYLEASLSAGGSLTVDFVNSTNPNSGGSAMTKQQMLDFDAGGGAGSWGCRIETFSGGVALGESCREMLTNNHYQVLEDGPLATTVLIREGPDSVAGGFTRGYSFGYQCTANCTAPYAASTWVAAPNSTYESMRPSFIVTFYRRWGRVRTHYLLDNGWGDRLQDQRVRLRLYNGATETNQVYDSVGEFFFPARARVFEEVWEAAPPEYSLDLNTQYMESTGVIPEFGPRVIGAQAIALEKAAFDASDQGKTMSNAGPHSGKGMGTGQWTPNMTTTGGRPDIGLFPRWDARLLMSWHKDLWTVSKGNANALMHTPIFVLEFDSTRNYCSSADCGLGGGTVSAFGRFISIDARPTFSCQGSGGQPDDLPTPVGTVTRGSGSLTWPHTASATGVGNDWVLEVQHIPEIFFVQYLITGDHVYLEGLQAWANHIMLRHDDDIMVMYGRARHFGFLNGSNARDFAWQFRSLGHATVLTSDGTPEKFYFSEKWDYNTAFVEAAYDIQTGKYYPPGGKASCVATTTAHNNETNPWCLARMYCMKDKPNALGFFRYDRDYTKYDNSGGPNPGISTMPWQHNYLVISYSHLASLFPEWKELAIRSATYPVKVTMDKGYGKPYTMPSYLLPFRDGSGNMYQTATDLWNGTAKNLVLSRAMDSSQKYLYAAAFGQMYAIHLSYEFVLSIGSEYAKFSGTWSDHYRTDCTVNASTDEVTCSGQSLWADGDALMVKGSPSMPASNPQLSGGDAVYVELMPDGLSVKLYSDHGLTQLIDFTGGGEVDIGLRKYDITSRGFQGTTATPHSVGEIVTWASFDWGAGGVEHDYDVIYLAALGAAAGLGASWTDEVDGVTVYSIEDAYDTVKALFPTTVLNKFGNNSDCAGLNWGVSQCDNPQWAMSPGTYPFGEQSGGGSGGGGQRVPAVMLIGRAAVQGGVTIN